MAYIPLETIATWPKPNYTNPQKRGPGVITMSIVLYALVLAVVGLRIFTRLRISRGFGADDIFILLAMIPTTAFVTVTLIAEWKYEWNRHAWDVTPDKVTVGLQISLASQVLFSAASAFTRLSMLFLTRRILSSGNKTLQKVITYATVFLALDPSLFIIVSIFQCRPISAYWTVSFVPQHCIDDKIHILVQGILNILSDFFVVLIPIPIVLGLNLPFRQRIIVALLFGAGFIVCFAGVVRTYYFYRVTDGHRDITWDAYPVWLSSAVELYIGIVCTSAPPTKPFFMRYVPKLLSATSQYIKTTRGQSPTYASSKNNTLNHTNTTDSADRDIEFEEMAGNGEDMKMRNQIHKKVEVTQSWLDVSRTQVSSSDASVEKLVL